MIAGLPGIAAPLRPLRIAFGFFARDPSSSLCSSLCSYCSSIFFIIKELAWYFRNSALGARVRSTCRKFFFSQSCCKTKLIPKAPGSSAQRHERPKTTSKARARKIEHHDDDNVLHMFNRDGDGALYVKRLLVSSTDGASVPGSKGRRIKKASKVRNPSLKVLHGGGGCAVDELSWIARNLIRALACGSAASSSR